MDPIQVLLVEDNEADADLALETLATSRLLLETSVVTDGAQALDYLNRRGAFAEARRPDLILLDLNLPKLGGREVLAAIKKTPELRTIPVVVLTSSTAETDIVESYDLGANCYVTKPVDLRAFQAIVHAVEGFWFTVVKLPPKE
jgi:two-component system, chemotaxis family, response regulator Rcp1